MFFFGIAVDRFAERDVEVRLGRPVGIRGRAAAHLQMIDAEFVGQRTGPLDRGPARLVVAGRDAAVDREGGRHQAVAEQGVFRCISGSTPTMAPPRSA